MKVPSTNKKMSINDLAIMVAEGFNDITERMATKNDVESMKKELKTEIQGLRNSVNNYLALSDKRYLELKERYDIVVKILKLVVRETKIKVDLSPLEKLA